MKKIIALIMIAMLVVFATACDATEEPVQDIDVYDEEVYDYEDDVEEPADYDEDEYDYEEYEELEEDVYDNDEEQAVEALDADDADVSNHPIIGTWLWMGSPYYVFNADGTGNMFLTGDLLWEVNDGILSICATPEVCRSIRGCLGLAEWYYVIDGDELHLDSTVLPDFEFTYTRG